jgi:proline racemase
MYGCFVTPPDDDGAVLGCVFWHKDGYSTACGHGTIAVATWAVHERLVEVDPDGATEFAVDVPSGRLPVRVRCEAGQVRSVAFRNVPSYVSARGLEIETSAGPVTADLSYGGAFYASVRSADLDLAVTPDDLPRLVALGREVKWALDSHSAAQHADDPRLSGVYGTIWWEDLGRLLDPPLVHQRNVTVFADGEVDRSPCGSGTSARLALLHDEGVVDATTMLWHDSVIGSRFFGAVVEETIVHDRKAVITEVEGSAYRTGVHEFVLDPHDPLGAGFQLR